jgi:hypothetical protein
MIGNGDITAFGDEFFKNVLPPAEIEAKMVKMDTTMALDPEYL